MRSGDHLGDAKCRKRAPRSSNLTFLLIATDRNGFRRMKEEGQIYKTLASDFLIFAWDLVMICQNLVMILPRFFFYFERPYKLSPLAKIKKSEAMFCSHEHDEQVCQVS